MPVGPGADGNAVSLDSTLFVPKNLKGTAPAVLLAHGFGGNKDDETSDALNLAHHGYKRTAEQEKQYRRLRRKLARVRARRLQPLPNTPQPQTTGSSSRAAPASAGD